MGRYASGSKAYGISDRSGFRYRLAEMKREWNGLLVGPDEYEEKHPQLTPPRNIYDPQALRNPRPQQKLPLEIDVGERKFPFEQNVSLGLVGNVGNVSIITTVITTFTVTVASGTNTYGTGNKYYIDGEVSPTLSLTEGQTYIFDQSDSSNSGHPLRISTTANGTHGGGSEYTTGVTTNGTPGSSGAYTQIVVASGAPTLHYYCSVHSGMGGQINT